MASLRERLLRAMGLLLTLQLAGTTLGIVSWWRVQEAGRHQLEIAKQREDLLRLAQAARELYVHQAHTFIERGPGHLDHLAESQVQVHSALLAVESGGVPSAALRRALSETNLWFAQEVVPLARKGGLDGASASALHQVAEAHASRVQAAVNESLAALDLAESEEMAQVREATRHTWAAVLVLALGGLGLGLGVAMRLTRGVLSPVEGLRRAARSLGTAEEQEAPERGDDELADLGRAFNEMVARLREAERQRLEKERLQALGEIAGAVAHELMSPIAAILAETQSEPVQARRVRAEAEHARRVIQGLLGFARPGEAAPIALRLDEAAAAAVDRSVPYADSRDVTLRWLGGPESTVLGSPTGVRQVLDNLLRNAVEASGPGAEVEVEVLGQALEVRDRGPGINPALRPRLYEPFASTRPEGTGLGLAVSQRIARALGGRILHLDRPGGGTIARWEVSGG